MALKDVNFKNAKPREKAYKLTDGEGLFLLITPKGKKYWRFKYRYKGKEKLLALGVYSRVSLAEARVKRNEARDLLDQKIDSGSDRKAKKRSSAIINEHSFEIIAREWFAKFSTHWTPKHAARIMRQFEKEMFPWLGREIISEITPPQLLTVLRRITSRKKETPRLKSQLRSFY